MYNRLKELRKKNNLKKQELAKKLEISRSSYGLYERGKQTLSVSVLLKLARFYHTSPDYIIGETDEIIPYGLD